MPVTPIAPSRRTSTAVAITIIGVLFFIFGFVTWLNGILIPYLQIACELTNFQALFVAFAFYISYFVTALPSAWVLEKTGFKNGMTLGLLVMAAGTLLFVPAALSRTYGLFLAGLFVMGTGLSILQTAANPYVTILGPRESAARRISIMGICNKLAGAIAPLILAYFILNDGDAFVENLASLSEPARQVALDGLAHRVINPYIVMTVVLVLLGIGIRFTSLPDINAEDDLDADQHIEPPRRNIFAYPHLILGVIAMFFYVGAEVVAGDTIIRYGISLGINISVAKAFTSYTLVSMLAGYILGIMLIPRYLSQRMALLFSAILGLVFTLAAVSTSGLTSVFFIAILGFANALVWPAIWPLALHNLGPYIKVGSALLIMSIAGGAVLPLIWGWLSDLLHATPQFAYLMLLPGYFIILYYAAKGYKIKNHV